MVGKLGTRRPKLSVVQPKPTCACFVSVFAICDITMYSAGTDCRLVYDRHFSNISKWTHFVRVFRAS